MERASPALIRQRAASSTKAAPAGRKGKKPAPARSAAQEAPWGAIERTLSLLEYLSESPSPANLATIAQATGMEPNTAHRLLERLVSVGYARKCGSTKRYAAAARSLFPMSLHHPVNRMRLEAREQLRMLRDRFDESVCLIVFVGLDRVIVDFVPGRESLSPLYQTRLRTPLHASAAGLVFLSGLEEDERRSLLGPEPFAATTPKTLRSYEALDEELRSLEADGYIAARQSTFAGVTAIAAPIRSAHRIVGCLAFTGSAHGMDDARVALLGEAIKDSAALISLGASSIKAVSDFLGETSMDLTAASI